MKRLLSLALVATVLFGSDVAFRRLDWPVVRLHATAAFISSVAVVYPDTSQTSATSAAQNTAAASLLAVFVCSNSTGSASTPTDSLSNTWTALQEASGNAKGQWYYVANPTVSGSQTFTINSGTGTAMTGIFVWASGIKTSSPIDQSGGTNNTSSSTVTNGSGITPSEAGTLVLDGVSHSTTNTITVSSIDSSQTLDSGTQKTYTAGGSNGQYGCAIAYEVQSGTTARNPTWTFSGTQDRAGTRMANFKAAATAVTPRRSLLLGVGN